MVGEVDCKNKESLEPVSWGGREEQLGHGICGPESWPLTWCHVWADGTPTLKIQEMQLTGSCISFSGYQSRLFAQGVDGHAALASVHCAW